jgi:uncharacterized protein
MMRFNPVLIICLALYPISVTAQSSSTRVYGDNFSQEAAYCSGYFRNLHNRFNNETPKEAADILNDAIALEEFLESNKSYSNTHAAAGRKRALDLIMSGAGINRTLFMRCGILASCARERQKKGLTGLSFPCPDERRKRVYAASDGMEAFDKGEYEKALREFRPLAEAGNPVAMMHLGAMYEKGLGVAKSDNEAMKFYRKAAEKGYSSGQVRMGWAYLDGMVVKKNEIEAVRWFKKAADQGDPEGEYALGVVYFEGQGVKKDLDQAVKWLESASNKGHNKARELLPPMRLLQQLSKKK